MKGRVGLRPFPYPFSAGLALSSDIDRCDPAAFIRIHQYLNCPRQGLGLAVSDSFFGVGRQYGHMAYYEDDGKTPAKEAELIRKALECGLIDTLHSWGAFDRSPPQADFLRNTAKRLTEDLTARGLNIKILSIHGAPINIHNLYARTEPNFCGDLPDSPFYTGDLVDCLGIKFYWASELLAWPLSIGSGFQGRILQLWRLVQNTVKNSVKRGLGKPAHIRRPHQILPLAYPLKLRDGRTLLGFSRFNAHPDGLWGLPTRHTLRYALSRSNLNRLIRQRGYLIVYTHFGMPADRQDPLFPDPDRQALENLAGHCRAGRIWVARTLDLLTYWLVFHHLEWTVKIEGDDLLIRIHSLADPTTGRRRPEEKELAGICFYTPRPRDTQLFLGDKPLTTTLFHPDETGRPSVGLALPENPDVSFLEKFNHF